MKDRVAQSHPKAQRMSLRVRVVPVLRLVVLPEPLEGHSGLVLVVLEDALPSVEIESYGDLGLLLFVGVLLGHDGQIISRKRVTYHGGRGRRRQERS